MNQPKRPAPSPVPPRGGSKNKPAGQRPRPSATRPEAARAGGGGKRSGEGGQGPAWERRRQQRRRRNLATIASVAVVAIAVALVVIKAASGSGPSKATAAPAAVVSQVSAVPLSQMISSAQANPAQVTGPSPFAGTPLTVDGKPSIVYIGAEYCPYCAAERWPMVMALDKFGTFSNLGATTSSSTDTNPNTPTFSFHGSTYTSRYISFTGVEQQNRLGGTLQKLTPDQKVLVKKYDAPPFVSARSAGTIPFVVLGGKYLISGASYDASALQNQSIERAASILTNPVDPSAAGTSGLAALAVASQAIAGRIVGVICSLTNNQPTNVCSAVPASLQQGGAAGSGKGSK